MEKYKNEKKLKILLLLFFFRKKEQDFKPETVFLGLFVEEVIIIVLVFEFGNDDVVDNCNCH